MVHEVGESVHIHFDEHRASLFDENEEALSC